MTRWLLLAAAILTEVAASLSLKASLGAPGFLVIVVLGYVAAFTCLSLALRRGMPLGVAYGIWAAAGVALTAVLSAAIFREPLTPLMLGGIVLVIAGVLCVELGSHRKPAPASASAPEAVE